jgi:hypothetical protein
MLRRNLCIHTLLSILLLATLTLTSQKSSAELDPYLVHNPYEWVAPTVTADGRVRVIITKTKTKRHLPKTQRPIVRLAVNDNDDDYYSEMLEFQVGYRRPELVDQTAEVNDDISDEIKIRLVLARKKALKKYQETWG